MARHERVHPRRRPRVPHLLDQQTAGSADLRRNRKPARICLQLRSWSSEFAPVTEEPTTAPSRREFLIRCAQLAVVLRGGIGALARLQSAEISAEFGRQELNLLAAAMDEVIPASDHMPSASAAGGVAYVQQLCWQYDNISKDIRAFLHVLQKASEEESSIGFADLESQRRVALMKGIDKSSAKLFSGFVAYVYEAYYTRPQVQGLLSCSIPAVPDDNDELLLAPVRKLAPSYRKCREE
jgi:hypothetical protein